MLTPIERQTYLARMNRMACGMEQTDHAYATIINQPAKDTTMNSAFIIPAGLVFCVVFWVYCIGWAIWG